VGGVAAAEGKANYHVAATSKSPGMSDPLKKKLRKKAKKAQRRAIEKALDQKGHHERERRKAKGKL
jgi:hypothetical protein